MEHMVRVEFGQCYQIRELSGVFPALVDRHCFVVPAVKDIDLHGRGHRFGKADAIKVEVVSQGKLFDEFVVEDPCRPAFLPSGERFPSK